MSNTSENKGENFMNEINDVNRIAKAFEKNIGKKDQIKTYMPYIVGGDPDIKTTKQLIVSMAKSGVDILQIGIPFSDPSAEDPVIQLAHERALNNGCTPDALFEMIKDVRETVEISLLLTSYMNPIFVYGIERFFARCAECGIDGIIVSDLPYEEQDELTVACKKSNVVRIESLALNSDNLSERAKKIACNAEGFIYCLSEISCETDSAANTTALIDQIKKISSVPCVTDVDNSASDGIIIGNDIVKLVEKYGKQSVDPVKDFVEKIIKEKTA